jgi:hypothetical protein
MKLSRLLLFPALLLFVSITIHAQDVIGIHSLSGLKSIAVTVEDTTSEMQAQGLVADEMRGRIEGRLRAANIKLAKVKDADAVLYFKVSAGEIQDGLFSVQIRAEVQQVATLVRNPKMVVVATTWLKDLSAIYSGGNMRSSLAALDGIVDRFIKDMGEANSLLTKPKGEARAPKAVVLPDREDTLGHINAREKETA